jgi:hypothetical protein
MVTAHNNFAILAFGLSGTVNGGAWCPGVGFGWSFLPSPDSIWYSIDNCAGKSIVVDSSGGLHICYVDAPVFYNTAYHAYSIDGGKSWTSEIISVNADAPQAHVGITIDSVDTLHFVWSEEELSGGSFGQGNEHIKYRNKTSAGVWSAIAVLSRAELLGLSTICLPCIQVGVDSLSLGVTFSGVACVGGVYSQVIQYNARSAAGVWSGYENTGLARGASSLDFDSAGIPHVCSMSYNAGLHDLMYTNRTGGAWVAPVLLVADVDAISNVVFDLLGQLHVCYCHGGDIYHIRRSVAGVWGAATWVAMVAANRVSIQVDPFGNCQVVYVRNDNGCYAIIDSSLVLGPEIVWYSVAGNEVGSFAVPWSHYPVVNSQFTQLSRQSNCFAFLAGVSPAPTDGTLLFTADDDSVLGGLSDPASATYLTQRQRGLIDLAFVHRIISPGLLS